MQFLNHSVCFVRAVHGTTSAGYILCGFGYHIIWWCFTLVGQSFSKNLNWTYFCRHTKMVCIFYIALTSNSNYIFCLNCCVPMRSWDNSYMSRCPVRSWVHYLVTSSANWLMLSNQIYSMKCFLVFYNRLLWILVFMPSDNFQVAFPWFQITYTALGAYLDLAQKRCVSWRPEKW